MLIPSPVQELSVSCPSNAFALDNSGACNSVRWWTYDETLSTKLEISLQKIHRECPEQNNVRTLNQKNKKHHSYGLGHANLKLNLSDISFRLAQNDLHCWFGVSHNSLIHASANSSQVEHLFVCLNQIDSELTFIRSVLVLALLMPEYQTLSWAAKLSYFQVIHALCVAVAKRIDCRLSALDRVDIAKINYKVANIAASAIGTWKKELKLRFLRAGSPEQRSYWLLVWSSSSLRSQPA